MEKKSEQVTIAKDAEVAEAMEVVSKYIGSFRKHHDKRVTNGIERVLSQDQRVTRFAVLLAAEMLVRQGLAKAELSWLKEQSQ